MSSPVDGTLNDSVVKEETIEEEMNEEQMTNMLKQLINEHLEKCNFYNIFTKTFRDCQESSQKRLIKVDHPRHTDASKVRRWRIRFHPI